jgi:RNA polymerase sigma-70 factor (ECF subfamily)
VDDALSDAVARLLRGDARAAADLDCVLRPRLLRYFRSGPWPRDEAEDLVQSTLARVFKGVEKLRERERFLPWVFTIARNVRSSAAERWAVRRAHESVGLGEAVDPQDPNDAEARELEELRASRAAAVEGALMRLPERQRQCLLLHSRERMSYAEIASTLRISVHTVRNHIAQAKQSLRNLLAGASEAGAS